MPNAFNSTQMELARRRRGLTKKALADAVGQTPLSIQWYASNQRLPAPSTVERLAHALRFPVDFFYAPTLDEPSRDGTSFRALSRLSKAMQDQALAAGAIAIAVSKWIDQRFALVEPSVPNYAGLGPEAAAEAVRSEWGIGERPVPNMVHRLEAQGVRVFSLVETTHDMDAFSCWIGGVPFVFLNTGKSSERSRMDAAHELGHLVLHRRIQKPGNRSAEHEADAFGAAFLMPRGSVLASAPAHGRLGDIMRAKHIWGVSVANLTYRMRTLRLLTDWEFRLLFRQIGRRGYRTDEPNSIPRETSQVLRKVFGTLRGEGVLLEQVARELNIYPDDLRSAVFGLVLTPVAGQGNRQASARVATQLSVVEGGASPGAA